MKKSLTVLLLFVLTACVADGQRKATNIGNFRPTPAPGSITDLALIYQGGTNRLPWTRQELQPYIYRKDGNSVDWLFDGFLFIEFRDNLGHIYANGYKGDPAGKKEWDWLLNRNFEAGKALHALDDVLDSLAGKGIRPARKRKVILTIPEPIDGFKNWGQLNNRDIDFNDTDDKIAACQWFVDNALARWKAAGFKNIELAGFYWVAEQNIGAVKVLPAVGKYVRDRKLMFYWIPYNGALGAGKWKELGFDVAYQQPNYFFNSKTPYQKLTGALNFAKQNRMALEMEFDSRVLTDSTFRNRYDAYIDEFSKNGVWQQLPVAYYEGGRGWLDMYRSKDSSVQRLYNKLADIISQRQQSTDQRFRK